MAIKKEKWGYRLSLVVIPHLYTLMCRILFATCRFTHNGKEYFHGETAPPQLIVTLWHYSIFYTIQLYKKRKWTAMVSASKDGEYVARTLETIGFETARGSTGKRGVGALKGMLTSIKKGKSAAIVADGSQGPALIAQGGAALLASRSGLPMVPIVWAADRYIAFRSWDRTVLPKPFSKISVWYGKPIYVPKGCKTDELEEYREKLDSVMNDLYNKAWGTFGITKH